MMMAAMKPGAEHAELIGLVKEYRKQGLPADEMFEDARRAKIGVSVPSLAELRRAS